MFKVGQKVRLVKYSPEHGVYPDNGFAMKLGTVCTIADNPYQHELQNERCIAVHILEYSGWYFPVTCFQSILDKPLTEVEWLDRVKDNFKE
jgi:hypothetical protein